MVSIEQLNTSFGRKERANSVMSALTNTLVEGMFTSCNLRNVLLFFKQKEFHGYHGYHNCILYFQNWKSLRGIVHHAGTNSPTHFLSGSVAPFGWRLKRLWTWLWWTLLWTWLSPFVLCWILSLWPWSITLWRRNLSMFWVSETWWGFYINPLETPPPPFFFFLRVFKLKYEEFFHRLVKWSPSPMAYIFVVSVGMLLEHSKPFLCLA